MVVLISKLVKTHGFQQYLHEIDTLTPNYDSLYKK